MLKAESENRIIEFLTGWGLSKSRSRKIIQRCRGSQPVKIGTIKFKLYPDKFIVNDQADGLYSGLNLTTGELI